VKFSFAIPAALLTAASIHAADPLTVARLYDSQLRIPESEVVSLAEAMPADKYGFAPTAGTFAGVRTFLLQVRHIATTNYMVCSAVQQQKPDIEMGKNENGSEAIKTKDEAVKYLKDSYAYCHKAMDTLTSANQLDMLPSPFGQGQMARGAAALVPVWHSFDHYGQMVEYARMNGIVPPASR
jgi:DinB superfamily